MGLSEDQKAMLRLLAQRGEQGYEDVAALKGLSVDEVRAQAREAVRQLEDEGLPPPAIPLEPGSPAPASKPSEETPAPEPSAAEAKPTPEAQAEPKPASKPQAAAPTGGSKPTRPGLRLPSDPGARAAIAAGLVAIVVLVVVLVVSGGGGDSSTTSAPETAGGETAAENPNSSNAPTAATLSPVAGGEGQGKAIFGRVKNKLALQVEATGLKPTSKGESYTVWIAESPQKMLPLASAETDKNGRIAAQFEVPTEVLAYLANETFGNIVVSRTSNALLKAALTKATKEKKAPIYTGEHVLEGEITGPIVGAAARLEEEEKAGG